MEGYPENAKNAVWGIRLHPRYKMPEFVTIAPVLTSTLTVCLRSRDDPSSLELGCVTGITEKHSRFGLAWRRPRADRGLSRPTGVFRTIYTTLCAIFFIQIGWDLAVRGPKPVWSNNRARPRLCLGSAINEHNNTVNNNFVCSLNNKGHQACCDNMLNANVIFQWCC